MKHKIGVIEGEGAEKSSVRQGIKILEAISRNTNLSFDFRFIKIGSKSKSNKEEDVFTDAAATCKSLDAILVLDDIVTDAVTYRMISSKATSVALQYEIETRLFDSLDKFPVIFEAEDIAEDETQDSEMARPIAAIMSIAKLIDFVGYKRFGDKIRLAVLQASAAISKSENQVSKDEQLVGLVVEYIDDNVREPMISSWGEI